MKATLIVPQNDSDHAQARALAGKLMRSNDPEVDARLAAPPARPGPAEILAYLTEQHDLSRADLVPCLEPRAPFFRAPFASLQ